MSRTLCQRLTIVKPTISSVSISTTFLRIHPFSISSSKLADEPPRPTRFSASQAPPPASASPRTSTANDILGISQLFSQNAANRDAKSSERPFNMMDIGKISSTGEGLGQLGSTSETFDEPHHFHVYATRHNCHITFTSPDRNPLISVSCGNIGFRKAGRKHYDSAFQLASYVMKRIREQGLLPQIKAVEVNLRGFGAGREAVTKALLGLEGRAIRNKIVKVSDSTRLKFGGTRSKKPRRL